jgi:Adenylosuccinate lyase
MAGGATGTFAAMGESGPAIQQAFAERLGLTSMPVPSRSIADPFAEVAEATPDGDVGSSTMPQKRNPKLCREIISISAQTRALVPLALEAMSHAHEVDGARTNMMDEALEQSRRAPRRRDRGGHRPAVPRRARRRFGRYGQSHAAADRGAPESRVTQASAH